MKLDKRHVEKVDPLLQDALARAGGEEILRAVMILGSEDGEGAEPGEDLDAGQFQNRQDYRRALIDQRQQYLAARIGPTVEKLKSISLAPQGGVTSGTVVIEGPARQILTSLDLPGVLHASLDRTIQLVPPQQRAKKRTRG